MCGYSLVINVNEPAHMITLAMMSKHGLGVSVQTFQIAGVMVLQINIFIITSFNFSESKL